MSNPIPPPPPRAFLIYADESVSQGARFSNFYGGALVKSEDHAGVIERLSGVKLEQHLFGEVKWSKITENYQEKYIRLVDAFFDEIEAGRVKVRVMFTENRRPTPELTHDQREHAFFILYYHFVKFAFGLAYVEQGRRVRLFFDDLPDTLEKRRKFRDYLAALSAYAPFRRAGVFLDREIAEVRSHDHVILQCVDVVLGAMQFRLNEKHLEKPAGAKARGRRTIAKEKVYKAINARIRRLRPNFNIGITTGVDGDKANRWRHAYRHWLFESQNRG